MPWLLWRAFLTIKNTTILALTGKSLTKRPYKRRISFNEVIYEDNGPEPAPPEEFVDQAAADAFDEMESKWWASRRIIQPEPGGFKVAKSFDKAVDFHNHFPDQHFQVIVKLANIELNPDKPDYEGGTWHIEGQLNERIAASAIYYYDSDNITPSSLAFRVRAEDDFDGLSYEQDQHHFVHQVYGFPGTFNTHDSFDRTPITQELGSVDTKQGRLITFSNKLQHRVSPFSLDDRSKPGHRKILALFLVDPHHRIISTANVAPQREDWRLKDNRRDTPEGVVETDPKKRSTMTME